MINPDYSNRELDEKFDDILGLLGRIESQTSKTNGRVTSLEFKRERQAGFNQAISISGGIAFTVLIALWGWTLFQVSSINTQVQSAVGHEFDTRVQQITQ